MAGVCPCVGARVTSFLSVARADDGPLSVALRTPTLRAGDRTELFVTVTLAAGHDARLALTPSTEGSTLEVVRGRILSSEARRETGDDGATRLVFAVPVIAHAPGAGVLRIDVDALVCASRCAHVQIAERFAVEVGSPVTSR